MLMQTTVGSDIDQAAALLRAGELVAFPTETVYGLGADATSDAAVAGIFAAKERPRFNPLIVHVATKDAAAELAVFPERCWSACDAFWPGPLTWVLPRRDEARLSPLVGAGLDTVAIRIPSHPVARRLLERVLLPIAAPSANRSGRISPTEAVHVSEELDGRIPLILDGGVARFGLESTVIDFCGPQPRLLRLGSITRDALEEVLGPLASGTSLESEETPHSPGQMTSHYAPRVPLRMNATAVDAGESLLAFGPRILAGARATINLSEAGDLVEAAARLFGALRRLDHDAKTAIAVMPIPDRGLGEAINDRLRRASSPRPLSQ